MRDLNRMRARYLRDGRSVRLGNLASNLLRLSNWVKMRQSDEAVIDLMREVAWLMEWSGDLASQPIANMQREIVRWRRIWPVEQVRSVLAFRALQMSKELLELSGLSTSPGLSLGKGKD